jgi:hypothetical protein
MLTFIKDYSITTIKNKLIILYMLNVTDIIATLILIDTGLIKEANPFMINVVQNLFMSFIVKIILPAALLIFAYSGIKKADNQQLKRYNLPINIITIFYALINILHLIWFFHLTVLI